MVYNCPKCRCGCLFEDHGKLVCLNCGAETMKSAAAKVSHVHNYKTYAGKNTGKSEEKPKVVPIRPSQSRTADLFSQQTKQTSAKKKQNPALKALIAIIIFSLLSSLGSLIETAFEEVSFSTAQPEYMSPESSAPGVLYWEVLGEISEEEMNELDELISDYNEKYESPDVDSVVAFIEENYIHDLPFRQWTVMQDGNDVRITFEK